MVYGYFFSKNLFGFPYDGDEPADLARCFFDTAYSRGLFLEVLSYLVQRVGFDMDGTSVDFGDMDSSDEIDRFEGVEIIIGAVLDNINCLGFSHEEKSP